MKRKSNWLLSKLVLLIFGFSIITSCSGAGAGGGSIGGGSIDTGDPIAVLQAIPSELGKSASLDISMSIMGSIVEPTQDSQVYNASAEFAYSRGLDVIATASLAHSINLILKELGRFSTTIPLDSATPVALDTLVLGEDIMKPLNANPSDYSVDYHGIMVKSIPASESPNNVPGFAYYLPFKFEHNTGPFDLLNYFELYVKDANNLVLRALTYKDNGTEYLKYHTSEMTIANGFQTLKRYENSVPTGGDDTSWSYDQYSYSPSLSRTKVYIINNAGAWTAAFADGHGGAWMDVNDTGTYEGFLEVFDQEGIIMRQSSDPDIGSLLPADLATAFDPDYTNYAYRYLQDNTGTTGGNAGALLTDITVNYEVAAADSYRAYESPDVSNATSHHFLLGATNTSIVDYANSSLVDFYGGIRSDLNDNLFPSGTAPVWTAMDPATLVGTDVSSSLSGEFDKFDSLIP